MAAFGRILKVTLVSELGLLFIIEGATIKFTVTKSMDRDANKASVTIMNSTAAFRRFIQSEGDLYVQVIVGYENQAEAVLFSGDLVDYSTTWTDTDNSTVLECGDAERRLRDSTVSFTRYATTTSNELIFSLAAEMGLGVGLLDTDIRTYVNGFTAHGQAADVLDQLVTDGKLWSVQDGILYVMDETVGNVVDAVLLTPETGLIGSPSEIRIERRRRGRRSGRRRRKKRNGIQCKCFINPSITPGTPIVVRETERAGIEGVYVVRKVTSTGSNEASGSWSMNIQALERNQPATEVI